jgi:hypothetical protein
MALNTPTIDSQNAPIVHPGMIRKVTDPAAFGDALRRVPREQDSEPMQHETTPSIPNDREVSLETVIAGTNNFGRQMLAAFQSANKPRYPEKFPVT